MSTISNLTFDAAMAAFSPYEARPHLAVAVSGGSDSMALAILAYERAKARGGQVTAITVDHGLRAGSALEAVQVDNWMRARGINHEKPRKIVCFGITRRVYSFYHRVDKPFGKERRSNLLSDSIDFV